MIVLVRYKGEVNENNIEDEYLQVFSVSMSTFLEFITIHIFNISWKLQTIFRNMHEISQFQGCISLFSH